MKTSILIAIFCGLLPATLLAQAPLTPAQRALANAQARANAPAAEKEKELRALIIKNLNVKDAPLEEVLKVLQKKVSDDSEGKTAVSFVVLPGVNRTKPVTLQLNGVPLTVAMDFLGRLTQTQFVIEAHAVVVKPLEKK